jgi:hypothetical protein
LSENRKLDISLEADAQQLEEVVVSSLSKNANVSKAEMSVERISAATIRQIPALMGETDVIKAIQLLPDVQATSEGSSGFSVRGGGYDSADSLRRIQKRRVAGRCCSESMLAESMPCA